MNGFIEISYYKLSISFILVFLAGLISFFMKLGLLKSIIFSTIRTIIQLVLIGYVLKIVFDANDYFFVISMILIMCFFASRTAVKRIKSEIPHPIVLSFLSLTMSSVLIGIIVIGFIISPTPIYSPRIVIPIFGMLLGNSMNAISLSMDRFYSEIRLRKNEIETYLAFGATKWESVHTVAKEAMKAGMTPILNTLSVAGIVSLPGMMTGQILGGVSPIEATKYQIVIMLMILASVTLGSLLFIVLSFRLIFDKNDILKEKI